MIAQSQRFIILYNNGHQSKDFIRCAKTGSIEDVELLAFENLAEEVERLRLKFPHIKPLPRIGGNNRRSAYQEYYTPSVKALIKNLYRQDLELGKYRF